MHKIFIDGSAGTTGLRIYDRLSERKDVELIILDEENRKNIHARKEAINKSDIAFLCLPDAASVEAVSLVENDNTAIIDTSTAHRTDSAWTYGFPELTGYREKIALSKRIANPGCHASGFISLVAPLVENGLIKSDAELSCFSLTGYSGGGKKMIADYECDFPEKKLEAPGMYGNSQKHKHLPEMARICGLEIAPVFCPIVAPYYSGMQVTVPLHGIKKSDVADIYNGYYNYKDNGLVYFEPDAESLGTLYAGEFSGRDNMQISVCGNDERLILVSRFDNLGKGASGAAIQNMNILMGIAENFGLEDKR